jgi:hypothetical protein
MSDEVAFIKETYAPGTRVRFGGFGIHDPWTTLALGTEGTVTLVDGMGTVHVKWDDGHSLGCILAPGPGERADSLSLISQ